MIHNCYECGCNIVDFARRLKLVNFNEVPNRLSIELVEKGFRFCPECGIMLYQKCPNTACNCDNVLFSHIDEECSVCGCEVVFCEKCGEVNMNSAFRCKNTTCNKTLKSITRVYMSNDINYHRTRMCYSQKLENAKIPTNGLRLDGAFSKSVIGDDSMYFWTSYRNDSVRLASFDILEKLDEGKWGELKYGSKVDVRLRDIISIEVYDCYILTCSKERIIINSAQDMELIDCVEVQSPNYRAVVLNDKLIVALVNSASEQEIVVFDIEDKPLVQQSKSRKSDNKPHGKIVSKTAIDERKNIEVTASSVIVDGCAYFAGYDGSIYKIDSEFNVRKISVEYPVANGEKLCVSQLIIPDNTWIYLITHTKSKTFFLNSQNAEDLQSSGECKRLFFDKVCFDGKRFYLFVPSSDEQIQFASTLASYSETFNTIDGAFSATDPICDCCIAEFDGATNLVYMKKSKTPYQLKLQRIPLSEGVGLPQNLKLSSTDVCDVSEFLLYENIVIICDHKANIITMKDWTEKWIKPTKETEDKKNN